MINEHDAEEAIQKLANQLPEKSETLIGAMVDHRVIAPEVYIACHREWRKEGGVPVFRAEIHYKQNPSEDRMTDGDHIAVQVSGIFNETGDGLSIKEYDIDSCESVGQTDEAPAW